MTTYNLTVKIATADLTALKQSGYSLCVAKKVNDKYNVVWRGDKKYLATNVFRCEDSYQVYGVNDFTDGALVEAATNVVSTAPGETNILDTEGVFHDPTGSPTAGQPIKIKNQFGSIHFGVNALVGGAYNSIYVSEKPFVSGTISLTPIRKLMVWFDTSSKTGTMFAEAISNAFEVDFTNIASATISYASPGDDPGNGIWSYGGLATFSRNYVPKSNTFEINEKALPTAAHLVKLNKILNGNDSVHSEPEVQKPVA